MFCLVRAFLALPVGFEVDFLGMKIEVFFPGMLAMVLVVVEGQELNENNNGLIALWIVKGRVERNVMST